MPQEALRAGGEPELLSWSLPVLRLVQVPEVGAPYDDSGPDEHEPGEHEAGEHGAGEHGPADTTGPAVVGEAGSASRPHIRGAA
jgi:hypothetical protein